MWPMDYHKPVVNIIKRSERWWSGTGTTVMVYRRSSGSSLGRIQSSSGLSTKLRLMMEGGRHQISQEAEYGTFDAADDEMTALLSGGPRVNRRRPTSVEMRRLLVLPVAGLALMACLALLHTAVMTSHRRGSSNKSTVHKYSEEDAALLGIRPALFSSSVTLEGGPIPPSVNRRDAESIAKVSLESLGDVPLSSGAPHVIFIMVDDAGLNDIATTLQDDEEDSDKGAWSSDQYMPTLSGLARDGVVLSKYYGMHLCTPARGAFLTGKHPIHLGLQHEVILPTHTWGLDPSVAILPQMLASANYTSHMVGKWHLGHSCQSFLPSERGFSSFYGYLTDQIDYYTKAYPYEVDGGIYTDLCYAEPGRLQAELVDPSQLSTQLWVDKAVNVIHTHAQRTATTSSTQTEGQGAGAQGQEEGEGSTRAPLFLYLAIQNNHSPLADVEECLLSPLQQAALSSLDPTKSLGRYRYTKLNMMLDNAVQQVMDALKSSGLYESSIVVVASDNGACYQSGGSNWPYRGTKHSLFEGGVRVPALLHSPLLPSSRRGVSVPHLFSIMDWAPTFLHLAGLKAPSDLDGVTQWGVIMGTQEGPARQELLLNYDAYETISTPTSSSSASSFSAMGEVGGMQLRPRPVGGVTDGRFKLLVNEYNVSWYKPDMVDYDEKSHAECVDLYSGGFGGSVSQVDLLLFDLDTDPYERVELQDVYPEVAARLSSRLASLAADAIVPYYSGLSDDHTIATWQAFGGYIVPWRDDDKAYISNATAAG